MNFKEEKLVAKEILVALINNGFLAGASDEEKLAKTKEAFSELLAVIKK